MPDVHAEGPTVERSRLRRFFRWFFGEGAGTLVALAAGLVAVFFTLFPDLKPFSATTKSADVSILAVERGVTRDEWRWRLAVGDRQVHGRIVDADRRIARRSPTKPAPLAKPYSVYVRTEAQGFKRRELTVRANLYRWPSRRQVRFLAGTEVEKNRPLARVPIDAPLAGSGQEIWVYDPGLGERSQYFVRVTVYDPRRAHARSRTARTSGRPPGRSWPTSPALRPP